MNISILFAAILFVAAAVVWLRKRYFCSPFTLAAFVFALTCGFNIHPILATESATPSSFSTATIIIINSTALLYLCLGILVPSNRANLTYSFRLRLGSIRVITGLCCAVCVADTAISIRTYGTLPIIASANTFGTQYYLQGNDSAFLSVLSWAAGTVAFLLLTLDCCRTPQSIWHYIRANKIVCLMVVISVLCNLSSGFRNTLIGKLIIFGAIYELTHRIRLIPVILSAAFVAVFFVIVGNFRFNALRVEDRLNPNVNLGSAQNAVGWLATYSEPILENLENFVSFAPEPLNGQLLVSSLIPSVLHDELRIERYSSTTFMGGNRLYSHGGFTFRTFYPELMMDAGVAGGAVLGGVLLSICFLILAGCFRNPAYLISYGLLSPSLFSAPLTNEFTKLYTMVPFIVWILIVVRRRTTLPLADLGRPSQGSQMQS